MINMANITQPPIGLNWFMQSKQPQGGLFGGVFNPLFGTQQNTQPFTSSGFDQTQQDQFDLGGRMAQQAKQAKDIVEYNYRHFYQGNFEAILWEELTAMMQQIDV